MEATVIGSAAARQIRSETFRTRWAAHNVRIHQTGIKHVHHPVVGDLSLTFEMMELRADTGLTILTYTAEIDPSSPTTGDAPIRCWGCRASRGARRRA
jgi:hypothetical protein